MIEVFKTNVNATKDADMLISHIHEAFWAYEANFDLQDCDKILRVKCIMGSIQVSGLIDLLHDFGFYAEVLQDVKPLRDPLRFECINLRVQMN
jgi:hypothetical protein